MCPVCTIKKKHFVWELDDDRRLPPLLIEGRAEGGRREEEEEEEDDYLNGVRRVGGSTHCYAANCGVMAPKVQSR